MKKEQEVMLYTTTYINRNFLLKVSGKDNQNQPINKLVGVSGLKDLIGEELLNKFVRRAIASKQASRIKQSAVCVEV